MSAHRFLVVMPHSTARVSTLVAAMLVADGREASVFVACDCGAWHAEPVMRIEAGDVEVNV
jgi:hypothetical protein